MKFVDNEGKLHDTWHKAIMANLKISIKPSGQRELMDTSPDGDRYQVPESYYYEGHPTPPDTPQAASKIEAKPVTTRTDDPYPKLNRFIINYEDATITAYDHSGHLIAQSKVDERLLYGLASDIVEETVAESGITGMEDILELAAKVNDENFNEIDKVVAAASGKNCILSPVFSEEFIECAAKNIESALKMYPLESKSYGSDFFKAILTKTEEIINKKLSQNGDNNTNG